LEEASAWKTRHGRCMGLDKLIISAWDRTADVYEEQFYDQVLVFIADDNVSVLIKLSSFGVSFALMRRIVRVCWCTASSAPGCVLLGRVVLATDWRHATGPVPVCSRGADGGCVRRSSWSAHCCV
jgi:hypothetical protein